MTLSRRSLLALPWAARAEKRSPELFRPGAFAAAFDAALDVPRMVVLLSPT